MISVVIRCYNEEQHIGRLLNGIMQQTVHNVELILVDSGSTDGTLAVASRYPIKALSIPPEDFSFGRALNVGCRAATGDFIAIASGHVYPLYKDWLERLLAPFENPEVALTYGKQRGAETTKYSEHQVFARWFPSQSNSDQDHPFCNNANAAIRRKVWAQMPYDEQLTGLEDIDWAHRAMRMGYKIAYQGDAEIIHLHNERMLQTYNRYRREAIALKWIFPSEHFNFTDFVRFICSNVFSDYGHALSDGLFGEEWFSILSFRLMQFWGTYRGFCQQGPVTSQLKRTFYYPNTQKRPSRRGRAEPEDRPRVDYERAKESHRGHH
jgi:rhamnosyltransferase